MLNVLVIESDPKGRLAGALRAEGYSVSAQPPGFPTESVLAADPDLCVVDCTKGFTLRQWETSIFDEVDSERVVFFLLVASDDISAVARHPFRGDFLVLSGAEFPRAEVVARVRRLIRKYQSHKDGSAIQIDGLVIDKEGFEVRVDEKIVELTYQEFLLLTFLAAKPGRVFSRQQLLNQVWGYDYFGGTRTVDIHIRRIRAKLGPRYERNIQTVRQVGYKFVQEARR